MDVPTVMFSNLFGKKKQEAHPVSTEAGLSALLQGMPRDDINFLGAVDDWLEEIPRLVNEIGLEVCLRAALRLDQASRQVVSSLLRDYLTVGGDRHLSKLIQAKLSAHTERLCSVYSMIACADGTSSAQTAQHGNANLSADLLKTVGLEYFRVLDLKFRLAKFRYRKPGPEAWQQAHTMLRRFLRQKGVTNASSSHRDVRDEIFREYLKIVCLALVPMNNLAPQQLEFVARMLASAQDFQCSPEPAADTTHLIDISTDVGPIPYKPDFWAADGAILYYLSVTGLRVVVQKFQEALEKNTPLPRDFATLPISRSQVAGVLSALNMHWSNEPPNRCSDRIVAIEAMRGALGFNPALRLVEITEKALSDGPVEDPHNDLLNRLWRLEEQIDKHRIEDWTQVDGNDDGVGVSIPTIQSQHVTGSLVSMRYADEPGWHLGVVKRVGIDKDGSSRLGLRTFHGSPKIVQINLSEQPVQLAEAGTSFRAIAFDNGNKQLLIPTGTYVESLKMSLTSDSIIRQVYLTRLIETGPDFELVEFDDE